MHPRQVTTLGKGIFLGIAGLAARTAITYLYTYQIIQVVGAEAYGIFAIALSLSAIGMILAESGLNLSTIHFTVRSIQEQITSPNVRQPLQRSITIGVMMSLLTTALFWVLSPWIASQVYGRPELALVIRLQSLGLPFFTTGNLLIAFTQAFKEIRYRFWVRDLLQPAAEISLGLLLLSFGSGINGLGLAFTVSSILFCLVAARAIRQFIPAGQAGQPGASYVEILGFSAPLFVSRILGTLFLKIPHLVLGAAAGFQLSGVFNVAWDLSRFGTFFLLAFSGIFSPMVAEEILKGSTQRLKELYALSTRWLLLISLPLISIMIIGASPLMRVYGEEFQVGYSALIILTLGQLVNVGVGGTDNIIVMAGRTRLDMLNNLFGLGLVAGLSYALIPRYQLVGAALAQALTVAAINLLKLVEIWLILHVHPFNRRFTKPFLGALLASAAAVAARQFTGGLSPLLQVTVSAATFAPIYLLSLLLLRPETADLQLLTAFLAKLGIKFPHKKG